MCTKRLCLFIPKIEICGLNDFGELDCQPVPSLCVGLCPAWTSQPTQLIIVSEKLLGVTKVAGGSVMRVRAATAGPVSSAQMQTWKGARPWPMH